MGSQYFAPFPPLICGSVKYNSVRNMLSLPLVFNMLDRFLDARIGKGAFGHRTSFFFSGCVFTFKILYLSHFEPYKADWHIKRRLLSRSIFLHVQILHHLNNSLKISPLLDMNYFKAIWASSSIMTSIGSEDSYWTFWLSPGLIYGPSAPDISCICLHAFVGLLSPSQLSVQLCLEP